MNNTYQKHHCYNTYDNRLEYSHYYGNAVYDNS